MTRVIVVEDDPHNAVLFRKLLEKRLGCVVTLTESPEELFATARDADVRLVVMDVSLAHSAWQGRPIGGVELCRMLKADPATRHVPVMLATAHAMRGDAERLLAESGADDYLSKPIVDHAQFVERVRALVEEAA
ncbi:MAG: response regulator [Candidatus Eisenbacteria bacterium]